MIIKFDLGFFLSKISPKKRRGHPRDRLLDDLLFPLCDERKIKDKFKNDYVVGTEMASRLFENKVDMPQTIQKEMKKDCLGNRKFAHMVFETFQESIGIASLYSVSNEIFATFNADPCIDPEKKEEARKNLSDKDYEMFLWNLFCLASLLPNRRGFQPHRKQGRPPRNKERESFYFLSEKEKGARAEYFIGHLCNENNHLTMDDLTEFIEILAYYPIPITEETKRAITYRFLKNWKKQKGVSDVDYLMAYFEDAKITFPDRSKNFDGWHDSIANSAARIELEKLGDLLRREKRTLDCSVLVAEFYNNVNIYSFYSKDKTFLGGFRRRKFFLPDFTGHINQSIWSFCHEVASFCGKTELSSDFCEYIKNIVKEHPGDNTVKDRCCALIKECETSKSYSSMAF